MSRSRLAAGLLAAPVLLVPASVWAGTDTDTLTVTATVLNACALNGGTMAFGQYLSGQTTNLDAVGQINYVNCSGTLTFELDGGQSADVNNRVMLSGTFQLRYQLYRNSTRTAVWGLGSNAQQLQLLTPLTGKIDVYGRIPSGQTVPAGSYTDTVNVTLTF
ncbi:MAG: spore coat U domain-containing protein [Geminicoccaceae bacterium]